MGLCPPTPQPLDGGGLYTPSGKQKKLWKWHEDFWDNWIPEVTRGEPYAVVINGDTVDGRHHSTVSQISQNLIDQKNIALKILRPIVERCEGRFYMIRGTEAHVGPSAEMEENLAAALGAISGPTGHHARYELWMRIGGKDGALCHFMHHIGTTGRTHYETSALTGEIGEMLLDSGRWRSDPPDIVVRSHRHRNAEVRLPAKNGSAICVTTPGWQLKTPFVYRLPGGRVTQPQCGGIFIRKAKDEEHYVRSKVYEIERSPEVVI